MHHPHRHPFHSPSGPMGGGHRHPGGPRRHGRPFDYGELRLLVLALIADQPRHGYDLIREIGDRFGGSYSPSPGVIYPTLSWLEDMGFAEVSPEAAGRKTYRITAEGSAFLQENRAAVDDLLARIGQGDRGGPPAPVIRAMENLRLALRLRLQAGALDADEIDRIAAALDTAAREVERKG
ncbi:MAG: PadR family transcriptional regulator [Paracoccaceae bacterium]